jgi:hypothetical protein
VHAAHARIAFEPCRERFRLCGRCGVRQENGDLDFRKHVVPDRAERQTRE